MTGSRLILGTAQLGGHYGVAREAGPLGDADANAILEAALERGVRGLDTAPDYGGAEERIGAFLEREPAARQLEIYTKLPALPAGLHGAELESAVVAALDRSRRRLRRETIDGYLVHSPADLLAYGEALVSVLLRCRDAGRIARIGVSVYDPFEADAALECAGLGVLQVPYNVFDRRSREAGCIDAAIDGGWWVFARSTLLQGLLVLDPDKLAPRLRAAAPLLARLEHLAREWQSERFALALAHAAHRSGADALVLGVDSAEQLHACVAALGARLDARLLDAIDGTFCDVPASVYDPRRWTAR